MEARRIDMEGVETAHLARVVRYNGIFCGVSGLTIAGASGVLPGLLGAGTPFFYLVLGLALAAYAVRLAMVSRKTTIPRLEAILIVGGDVAWVAASAAVVAAGILTPTGVVLVSAAALVVGAFAVAQWRRLPAG